MVGWQEVGTGLWARGGWGGGDIYMYLCSKNVKLSLFAYYEQLHNHFSTALQLNIKEAPGTLLEEIHCRNIYVFTVCSLDPSLHSFLHVV